MSYVFKHRLKIFCIALLVIGFAFFKLLPSVMFKSVISANEGIGYASVVSALSRAGAYVEAHTEPGSIDRAQGYRYALRRIEQWNDLFMSDHDARTPTVNRCPTRLCKFGFDNPDTVYLSVGPVSSKYGYRIYGEWGTVSYITYQLFNIGPDGFGTSDTMESSEIVLDENGHYEIFLGTGNPDNHPNFMQLSRKPGGGQLIIRQLIKDWNREIEPTLNVEVLDGDKNSPAMTRPLDSERFELRALALGRLIENNIRDWREKLMNSPVNDMPAPVPKTSASGGGFVTNHTAWMRFELQPGMALLMEIPKADVVYSNIQLANMWGESLDYGTHMASLNDLQSHLDDDNVYRYVIALDDPGVPNWLDPVGHGTGGVLVRFQSPKEKIEKPRVRLVPLASLRDGLPANHPVVSPAERAATLRDRLAGLNRKKNPVYRRNMPSGNLRSR